jgi:hypothetical protein
MTWLVFFMCAIKLREPNDDYSVQGYLAMELIGAVCDGYTAQQWNTLPDLRVCVCMCVCVCVCVCVLRC